MFEEFLEHIDDRREPARRHSLSGAPSVDFLNELWLDPDVDICGFPFHAGGGGALSGALLDKSRQNIDSSR